MGAGETPFREGPGRLLAEAPYRPAAELNELFRVCREWSSNAAKADKYRPKAPRGPANP
jgi:CRISPR/Cas system-associated protein Csm6